MKTTLLILIATSAFITGTLVQQASAPPPIPPATDVQCTGCVDTVDLADMAVTLLKLASNAVDSGKIVDNTVTSADITDGTIQQADLAFSTTPNDLVCTSCVDTSDLADGAVTTSKISDGTIIKADISTSFMKFNQLLDDVNGHNLGWDPNGVNNLFFISDSFVQANSIVLITINDNGFHACTVSGLAPNNSFIINCLQSLNQVPANGAKLNYVIISP